jgi:hypothetical protein
MIEGVSIGHTDPLRPGYETMSVRASFASALQPLILLACFLGGLLFQFVTIKAPANIYDEGLVLHNATRILEGQAPYRDFWTLYAPGYFYVLAGLFKFVGTSMLVARVFDVLIRFLVTLAVYLFARRMVSWWAALVPYAFASLWLASIRFYVYPAFPALGAIFLALILFARYLETGRQRWLFFAGLALGLTAALRLDFGGYAAVGIGLGLLVHQGWAARQAGRSLLAALPGALRAGLVLAGGMGLVALPLFGALAIAAGPAVLWEDLVHFPATTFREVRRLNLPALLPDAAGYTRENWEDWLRLYLPSAVFIAALAAAALLLRRGRAEPSSRRGFLAALFVALAITGAGLVVKATSRFHDLHALPAAFLAVVTATALFSRIAARLWRSLPFIVVFSLFLLSAVLDPYVLHFTELFEQVSQFRWDGCYSTVERAGCVPLVPDQQAAVAYVRANTRPDEYLFVANFRHDRIIINDVSFYFLAARRSPTAYTELHPGLATTRAVQQAIIADLIEKDVRWVVVSQGYIAEEPNASSLSSGVTDLDEFIRAHYRPVMTNSYYHVYTR